MQSVLKLRRSDCSFGLEDGRGFLHCLAMRLHLVLEIFAAIVVGVLAGGTVVAAETAGAPHPSGAVDPGRYVQTNALAAAEANQAAAADRHLVYAIDNSVVAKYDRATGRRLAISTGLAKHLNSGFLWNGKLYCAHSNYPRKPEKSEIMVLDPATMVLSPFHDFGEYRGSGSLTWAVRQGEFWWCNFAHYGDDNAKTVLVKLDANWRELGAWTYPPEVVKDLGRMSISGGLWMEGLIFATGHDHRVIYRLRLPKSGTVLELVDTVASPFPGQGIAVDPVTGGLVGIDRGRRLVVFATLVPVSPSAPSKRKTQ